MNKGDLLIVKSKRKKIGARILISLLGVSFILWGVGTIVLGIIGEHETAVITSIRRQGGERSDGKPGRYTYSIGYTFILPDGKRVSGSTTKIRNAVFLKTEGKSVAPVRYLKSMPTINALEEDTKPSFGQLMVIFVGTCLIVVMNNYRRTS